MYTVKFLKYFVNGTIKGLTYDETVRFSTLELANEYMTYLLGHTKTPVKAIGSADYTCHVIRIER